MSIDDAQHEECDCEQDSLGNLGLPEDRITVFGVDDAPDDIREYDVSGSGRYFYVVPDCVARHVAITDALVCAEIQGGTIYVLP